MKKDKKSHKKQQFSEQDLISKSKEHYKFSGSSKTVALKKNFMNAYVDSGGNISFACKQVNIDRASYYRWQKKDPEFKRMTEELLEEIIDSVESHLQQLIQSKDVRSTIFFLETKGKKRGYIKRTENINTNQNFEHQPREIPIKLNLPNDEKERLEMEKRLANTSQEETKEVSNLPHKEKPNNSSYNPKK